MGQFDTIYEKVLESANTDRAGRQGFHFPEGGEPGLIYEGDPLEWGEFLVDLVVRFRGGGANYDSPFGYDYFDGPEGTYVTKLPLAVLDATQAINVHGFSTGNMMGGSGWQHSGLFVGFGDHADAYSNPPLLVVSSDYYGKRSRSYFVAESPLLGRPEESSELWVSTVGEVMKLVVSNVEAAKEAQS